MTAPMLAASALVKTFVARRDLIGRPTRLVHAVEDVSFSVAAGETLGLVGESGSGKSTVGRLVAHLLRPDHGTVHLDGHELTAQRGADLRQARRNVQVVFQDPYASLDPSWVVSHIVTEGLRSYGLVSRSDREARAVELLELVGLRADQVRRYPYEFSGGQRQRIAIARALALEPKVLICDEAVSALDASTQAAILLTLEELQVRLGLSYVFISHDLSVVRHVSNRIAVMYLGRIVETATAAELYDDPRHPYTKALLSAIPTLGPRERLRITLAGDLPDPSAPPPGCAFHTRCPVAFDRCRVERPVLAPVAGAGAASSRLSACHLTSPPTEEEPCPTPTGQPAPTPTSTS